MRVKVDPHHGITDLQKTHERIHPLSLYLSLPLFEDVVSRQQSTRRESLPELNIAGTLILDLQPSELCEN
jgi:hypothetical protein